MNKGYISILKGNKGAALIISLFIMLLLALIGAAALLTSSTETKISGNVMTSKKAFYAAEAGLERFKAELGGNSNWTTNADENTWVIPAVSDSLSDGISSYVVTILASPTPTSNTIAVRSVGTFHDDATATIEAYFDKGVSDKVLIADEDINAGRWE